MTFNDDRYSYCRIVRGDSLDPVNSYFGTDMLSRSVGAGVGFLMPVRVGTIWKYSDSHKLDMTRVPKHVNYYFQICFEL